MDNAITTDTTHKEAVELHLRIKTTWQIISSSLVDFCAQLKEMRDKQLYRELGHGTFDAYVEAEVGLKSRQAYYYISTYERLGPALLEEQSGLGITKLRIIADVPALDRAQFLEGNDLDSMTVEDLRTKLEEVYGVNEQLTLQLQEKEKEDEAMEEAGLVDDMSDRLREAEEARAAAEAELAVIAAAEENEITTSEENIREALAEEMSEKLEAEKAAAVEAARAEMEKEKEKAVKAAKKEAAKEAAEKAKQGAAGEIEKARQEAAAEAGEKARAEVAEKLAALEEEAAAAEERARKLEKELNLSAGKETAAFALHFDQLQQHFAKMVDLIEAVQNKGDDEGAEKLAGALEKGLDMLKSQLYEEN